MAKAVPKPGSKEARDNYCSCPEALSNHRPHFYGSSWWVWLAHVERDEDGMPKELGFSRQALDVSNCKLHGSRPEDELPDTI